MTNPFHNLSREALLQALTEYYQKYRDILEFGGSEEQYARCKLSLEAILRELNSRQHEKIEVTEKRSGFNFSRYDSKAD